MADGDPEPATRAPGSGETRPGDLVGGTPEQPRLRDYVRWHVQYDDPDSSLSKRLRCVQAEVAAVLDRGTGPVRLISACAGDGRDVLGVLAGRADRHRVSGTFLEIDPVLVAAARARITELGLTGRLQVLQRDAGATDSYLDLEPADLVMVSGIMGNITPADIERLVHTTRTWAAPGATVIWTRGSQEPDLGPDIRRWFGEAGYVEIACHERIEGSPMRVGVNRLVADPLPPTPGERIFTFHR